LIFFSPQELSLRANIQHSNAEAVSLTMNSASASSLSRRETWHLLVLAGAGIGIIVNSLQGDGAPLIASIAFSSVAFALTFSLIRWLGPVFMRAGLKGKDMAKPRRPEMYEQVRIAAFCPSLILILAIRVVRD
jgi:UDP-N-acetylglucosamine--dolichyl-phosphate N-acetylglucosaminephosphotransferase